MMTSLTSEAWGKGHAPDRFVRSVACGDAQNFEDEVGFARCVKPLLSALGWRGQARHLVELIPHCADKIDLLQLRNILANADYQSRPIKTRMNDLDMRLMPCLFVTSEEKPLIILGRDGNLFDIYDPLLDQYINGVEPSLNVGNAYIFERIEDRSKRRTRKNDHYIIEVLGKFKKQIAILALIGFITSLPGLVSPLFILVLYDTVIAAQSKLLLVHLSSAILAVMIIDLFFRLIRARIMAYVATRMGRFISLGAFARLMELSPEALSQAPMHAQLRRVRQFEGWRDYFADPLVSVAFNLPYSILFLVAISIIGGSIVLLPMAVMAIYAGVAWFVGPILEKHSANASEARQLRDACFDEMISEMRSVRSLAIETVWFERFRNYAAGCALAGAKRARLQDLLSHMGQGAVTIAGTGTLVVGAVAAMNGTLTIGSLIASMALVWRVLTPWQQCIGLLPRIAQLKNEAGIIDQTLRLPAEAENRHRRLVPNKSCGSVLLSSVALTYGGASRPALIGVDLSVGAGEMIGFVGDSGAGKSSLLKVIAGIYTPQSGSARIDGFDLRQLNPRELREHIAYAPQQPHFFTGTIAQNLRLALPSATDQQLWDSAMEAGVLEDITRLKNGFETRIGDAAVRQQPPGFLQRLSLARAYLKKSDILILDEPERAMDAAGEQALLEVLANRKGHQTILLVTHRRDYLGVADRLFVLKAGRIGPYTPDTLEAAQPFGERG